MLMFHSFSLMEEDFLQQTSYLVLHTFLQLHTHTCCLKCGRSKKFIYSTSLSSVLPCNKSHLPYLEAGETLRVSPLSLRCVSPPLWS